MKGPFFLITTIVLFLALLVAAYFIFDFNGQINDLEADKKGLEKDLEGAEEDFDDLQTEFDDLQTNFDNLQIEFDGLTLSFNDLQLDYDDLYAFTYCGADLPPLTGADYKSNTSMSDAFSNWVDETWGKPTNDGYLFFAKDQGDSAIHWIATSGDTYFFVVFFDDYYPSIKEGVLFVNEQCWLDLAP